MEIGSEQAPLGIVGAGAMGAGIAQVALEKGELAPALRDSAGSRLRLATRLEEFAPCGAVIEAVIEDLEVKRRVFTALEGIVAGTAILASNTSSLPIGAIARACRAST